jgi:hypothetical protein
MVVDRCANLLESDIWNRHTGTVMRTWFKEIDGLVDVPGMDPLSESKERLPNFKVPGKPLAPGRTRLSTKVRHRDIQEISPKSQPAFGFCTISSPSLTPTFSRYQLSRHDKALNTAVNHDNYRVSHCDAFLAAVNTVPPAGSTRLLGSGHCHPDMV